MMEKAGAITPSKDSVSNPFHKAHMEHLYDRAISLECEARAAGGDDAVRLWGEAWGAWNELSRQLHHEPYETLRKKIEARRVAAAVNRKWCDSVMFYAKREMRDDFEAWLKKYQKKVA